MILIRVGFNEEVYTLLSKPNLGELLHVILINRIRAICGST
jgi:hypothetical protein